MALLIKGCLFLAFALVLVQAQQERFDSRFPHSKTWWATHITDDIYTAGRLSSRQVKYAVEAGFRTIIANFNITERGEYGGEELPTTKEVESIIELAPPTLFAGVVSGARAEQWDKVENIYKFGDLVRSAPRPILFYCDTGFPSTFIALAYLAMESKKDPRYFPKVNSTTFYQIAARHGLDYSNDNLKRLVSQVTGEPVERNPATPQTNPTGWRGFWMAKPVLRNYFVAGQVQSSHLNSIANVGFQTLVNVRKGVTTRDGSEDKPTQEEVNLLNIKSNTLTYERGGRQTRNRLLETRIDPYREDRWINKTSRENYESTNPLEFGDHIGYNEEVQSRFHGRAVRTSDLKYEHMPIGGEFEETDVRMWDAYRERLMTASRRGGVLIHGGDSKRAVILAILGAGWEYAKDSHWAFAQANEMGYAFNEREHYALARLFRDVLDKPRPFTPPPYVKYTTRYPGDGGDQPGSSASALTSSIVLLLSALALSLR